MAGNETSARGHNLEGRAPKSSPTTSDAAALECAAMKRKPLTVRQRADYHRLEDVIGCKWSVGVVAAIGEGVRRPGELERHIPGISTKVLNERLRKLLAFGVITRKEFSGLPARVEYHLTPTGKKLAKILAQLHALNDEHGSELSVP